MYDNGLPAQFRALGFLAVMLGIAMAIMDGTVANVALPTIGHAFAASPESTIWIVNAYQLALVMCLLPLAALGEIVGYRRIYLVGLAVFTIASLLCAASNTLMALTIARALQGEGGAGIMSVNLAIIRYKLGKAIGFNAVVTAAASTIGPTFASAVLWLGDWPYLFLINVPLGTIG